MCGAVHGALLDSIGPYIGQIYELKELTGLLYLFECFEAVDDHGASRSYSTILLPTHMGQRSSTNNHNIRETDCSQIRILSSVEGLGALESIPWSIFFFAGLHSSY